MTASRGGFTLVEVLAALAVSGALFLCLFGALDLSARYRTAGRDQAECDRIAVAVARYFEATIREAPSSIDGELDSAYEPRANRPPRPTWSDADRLVDPLFITGDETTLIVASPGTAGPSPRKSGSRTARLITGEPVRTGALPGLWRRRTIDAGNFANIRGGGLTISLLSETEPATTIAVSRWQAGEPIVLSDRVSGLKFRYFDGLTWTSRWDGDDDNRLQAVEVSFVAHGGAVARPVQLVIAAAHGGGMR